jgi:hypothetical protein
MVISLRFWAEILGIVEEAPGGMQPSAFGAALLDPDHGWDPYLERQETLWTLHWRMVHPIGDPMFAWDTLFGNWLDREWTRTSALAEFARRAVPLAAKPIAERTLEQHLDVFLRTYLPPSNRTSHGEDDLDSPLTDLRLVECVGERHTGRTGRMEPVYSLRLGVGDELPDPVFAAALIEYWSTTSGQDLTLPIRGLAFAPKGPGRVFGLTPDEVRDKTERIDDITNGLLRFRPSGLVEGVVREAALQPQQSWAHALAPTVAGARHA